MRRTRHTMETSSDTSAPTVRRLSTAISAGDCILASGVACRHGRTNSQPEMSGLAGCVASYVHAVLKLLTTSAASRHFASFHSKRRTRSDLMPPVFPLTGFAGLAGCCSGALMGWSRPADTADAAAAAPPAACPPCEKLACPAAVPVLSERAAKPAGSAPLRASEGALPAGAWPPPAPPAWLGAPPCCELTDGPDTDGLEPG